MGNQIILAPEAEQDLNEIVAYIAKDNPTTAEKFGIRLIERVELLNSFPRLGREISGRRGERVLVEGVDSHILPLRPQHRPSSDQAILARSSRDADNVTEGGNPFSIDELHDMARWHGAEVHGAPQ
jgi:plasmid stabilization system protein ParE